jgi:hypothetical protein
LKSKSEIKSSHKLCARFILALVVVKADDDPSTITMKFLLLGYCSLALSSVAAFSAVAPKKTDVASSMVDRSMKNVDAGPAFDPTTGAAPAVQRNNNNEVWVSQVRVGKIVALCFSSTKV